jgi:DNA-directed RNA polymerase subunit alpha
MAERWPDSTRGGRISKWPSTPRRGLLRSGQDGGVRSGSVCFGTAEALRYDRKYEQAMNVLDQLFGPIEQTAEYLYQRGATVAAIGGNPRKSSRLYERAVERDSRHPGALFGLALENDRAATISLALRLYKRAASCFPTHIGA